ncbi:hypothetical protein MHU86_3804 [Fragilaria crotonensis]|nr:hypothetical protein MHU86_3804 [Fragilaria crotonensis]
MDIHTFRRAKVKDSKQPKEVSVLQGSRRNPTPACLFAVNATCDELKLAAVLLKTLMSDDTILLAQQWQSALRKLLAIQPSTSQPQWKNNTSDSTSTSRKRQTNNNESGGSTCFADFCPIDSKKPDYSRGHYKIQSALKVFHTFTRTMWLGRNDALHKDRDIAE